MIGIEMITTVQVVKSLLIQTISASAAAMPRAILVFVFQMNSREPRSDRGWLAG